MRNKLPAELQPHHVPAVLDNREQLPPDISPLPHIFGTLDTGDASVLGLERFVAIERKSLPDYIGCCTTGRERFERCLMRLKAYEVRAVVCEFSMADLEAGEWRSALSPASAIGSFLGWSSWGIPFILAGNRESAEKCIGRLLFIAARRRWREIQPMLKHMLGEEPAEASA